MSMSNFASRRMLPIFCLLFIPSSCRTTQHWSVNDNSYDVTPVPCKDIKANFPCGKILGPLRKQSEDAFIFNVTRYPSILKKSNYTNAKTTKDPISLWLSRSPHIWHRTVLPWEITFSPLPWKYDKTLKPLPTSQTPFPFPWRITKITRPLLPWDITISPYIYNKHDKVSGNNMNGTVVALMIIIGVAILMSLSYTYKYYWKSNGSLDSSSISEPILQPPPRSSLTVNRRFYSTPDTAISFRHPNPTPNVHRVYRPAGYQDSPTLNGDRTFASDNPPDYSSVVSDYLAKNGKFPEVRAPDEPPPPYDEKAFHI